MTAKRPDYYDEKTQEHKRKLREDPGYLEQFLSYTAIEDERFSIEEKIRSMYTLHKKEDTLPTKNELCDIIELARKDYEQSNRDSISGIFGFVPTAKLNSTIEDFGYCILTDRPAQYFQMKEQNEMHLSYKEAIKHVEENGRFSGYLETLSLAFICAFYPSDRKNGNGILAAIALLPIGFAIATVDVFLPKSTIAKRLSKERIYEETPEGKEYFGEIQREINPVIEYYKNKMKEIKNE